MALSKGDIDKLGNNIRDEGSQLKDSTLEELQVYRTSYKDSLANTFNILCFITKQINIASIVTYRIKRFESIIGKLHRYPEMRFSRMWDIGGCRCILKNDFEVQKLHSIIEKKFTIRKTYDYIKTPQKDGYRSLHLFISLPEDDKIIEVQLRNQNDHNWATLVEISDLLFNARLKEYGYNKELLRFHYLLAQRASNTTQEHAEIVEILKKYNYVEKLSEVFSRNYIQVRQQWLSIETKNNNKFFLIQANKDDVPKITSFATFNEAESNYFIVYKENQNANVVLTHLPRPKYSQISMAYSNYILTFHSFIDDCYTILENVIVESLKQNKILNFHKYYTLYVDTIYNHIKNLASEVKEVNELTAKKTNSKSKKSTPKNQKEWIRDINEQIEIRKAHQGKLQNALNNNIPSNSLKKYFIIQIVKYVNNRYDLKFKKVLASV